jgi:hypothetical protein
MERKTSTGYPCARGVRIGFMRCKSDVCPALKLSFETDEHERDILGKNNQNTPYDRIKPLFGMLRPYMRPSDTSQLYLSAGRYIAWLLATRHSSGIHAHANA